MKNLFRFTVLAAFCLTITFAPAQKKYKPGVARWPVKISVVESKMNKKAKRIALQSLLFMPNPQDVKRNDVRYQDALIPYFENPSKLREGDIVRTTGWFHLVGFEDDGDYHIQISRTRESGDSCLIVEVPHPDFVTGKMKQRAEKVRKFVRDKILKGAEPGGGGRKIKHPQFVYITGQLFFDSWHVPDKEPRGMKGMKAATLWEIHPVTSMGFAKEP
ncbi:MAG: hypothetical protein HYY49_07720 [Ignavibacteriales bacterium]|nr:hypothetical protein [Ignavibacteriales bacterium]